VCCACSEVRVRSRVSTMERGAGEVRYGAVRAGDAREDSGGGAATNSNVTNAEEGTTTTTTTTTTTSSSSPTAVAAGPTNPALPPTLGDAPVKRKRRFVGKSKRKGGGVGTVARVNSGGARRVGVSAVERAATPLPIPLFDQLMDAHTLPLSFIPGTGSNPAHRLHRARQSCARITCEWATGLNVCGKRAVSNARHVVGTFSADDGD
jgi:hypothetical protein